MLQESPRKPPVSRLRVGRRPQLLWLKSAIRRRIRRSGGVTLRRRAASTGTRPGGMGSEGSAAGPRVSGPAEARGRPHLNRARYFEARAPRQTHRDGGCGACGCTPARLRRRHSRQRLGVFRRRRSGLGRSHNRDLRLSRRRLCNRSARYHRPDARLHAAPRARGEHPAGKNSLVIILRIDLIDLDKCRRLRGLRWPGVYNKPAR